MFIVSKEEMSLETAMTKMLDYVKSQQEVDSSILLATETLVNYIKKMQLNRQQKYEKLKKKLNKENKKPVGRPKREVNFVSLVPEVPYTCDVIYLRSTTYVYCSPKYVMLVLYDVPAAVIRCDGKRVRVKSVFENDQISQSKMFSFLGTKKCDSLTVSQLEELRDREFDLSCPRIQRIYRKVDFYKKVGEFCADNNYMTQ